MDNLFKALLIFILLVFLYLYYENSNNGRFSYTPRVGVSKVDIVFDKKTGAVYRKTDIGFVSIHYINGTKKIY